LARRHSSSNLKETIKQSNAETIMNAIATPRKPQLNKQPTKEAVKEEEKVKQVVLNLLSSFSIS
jgi:hypothetical protein